MIVGSRLIPGEHELEWDVNWKGGTAIALHFVDEKTDLNMSILFI